MDTKEVYKQLTNVDIEQQKLIWDERGKGYYGEYLLFCELCENIPGTSKILMNLNIPVAGLKTTEIDLLLIHESGLYVFEIKHYKGAIYGKDTDKTWTQYFRTTKNNVFRNPIEQNNYHVESLKKLFPDVPIFSVIVFTNRDCEIRVDNTNPDIDVCSFIDIYNVLEKRFSKNVSIYSMSEIDDLFNRLSVYSQMNTPAAIDGTEASFFTWIEPTISKLEKKRNELEEEKLKIIEEQKSLKKSHQKDRVIGIFILLGIAVIASFVIFGFHNGYKQALAKNTAELELFKQKFLHVDEIDNEYIDKLDSYVKVSNVKISPLTDDAVSFSASLTNLNDVYNVVISENAKYIVMTKSGEVFEYDLFGGSLKYNQWSNILGRYYKQSVNLAIAQFYGINNPKEITYIKIINIQLTKTDIGTTVIKDNLEIELYSK